MKFDIITIFPELFTPFINESIIKRTQDEGIIEINIHNLRDYTEDKHKRVDDSPYGGERGMVMMIEPIYNAINSIKEKNGKVITFSPRGEKLNQKMLTNWSEVDQLVILCGRYEGMDERVMKYVDHVVSLGDYVLMGGEIGALAILEGTTRLLPGALGKSEELRDRITKEGGFTEYPQYTRPEEFMGDKVPDVLLSGHHKKIKEWREKNTKLIE